MNTPRLADLREPPVVGQFYLVPFVRAKWYHYEADWPVYGPLHEDAKHFSFNDLHYHIDPRFVQERFIKVKGWLSVFGAPIGFGNPRLNLYPPKGRPREKRMKCKRIVHPTLRSIARDLRPINAMQADYGKPHAAAIHLADGRKLCPHRKLDLSQFPPDDDGLTTCPMHGLRVDCR